MKKIIVPISTLFIVGLSHAQTLNLSTNQNYVYSKTYLDYNETTASKTAETVQYFDGLGRPKQIVNIKASPLQKDVVTHIEYDAFGRQVKDYLPVPQTFSANGSIFTAPLDYASNPAVYGTEKFYSEKTLENSPLDRIQQHIQVGNEWSAKPVKFDYGANIDGEVKKYVATFNYSNFSSLITLSGNYGVNQLYKNTVTDEDGNKTIEFKNGQGQTLLVRKMLDDVTKADTYYVYNDYNQLAYVIPPLAVTANTVDETTLNNLCYQYKYDERNRLVEKKLPGKGWEYMVYDKADRLVGTQDANLRLTSTWLVTKYDRFGRVIYTGLMPLPNETRESLQGMTNPHVIVESSNSTGFTKNGMQIYYTNSLYSQIETVLSVNYYDTYPAGSPTIPTQILGQNVLQHDAQNSNISTKSLPVASYVKNIEDDNWTKNYTWYDTKGRAIGSHSINHLGGYTKTESELDFSGTPKMAITKHKRLDSDAERIITENFTYDHQNRLLTHTHQVDNNPVEYLVQNKYNELSQLEYKKVGGTGLGQGLQQIDYKYNIRGWMTQINNPADLSGGDLFGYKIKYNQVDGQQIPNSDFTNLQVKPKYNGNIVEIDWKTNTTTGDNLRRYGYVYDGLNRLLAGFYQKDTNPTAKEYFEKMDYDLNGNITNLKRSEGILNGSGTAMTIDNLNYIYTGNRLNSVTDISSQYSGYPDTSGNTISYDLNGNMKDHKDKGILQIDYNFLNLPKFLKFDQLYFTRGTWLNTNTTNYYKADGSKIRKEHRYSENSSYKLKTTEYLDGFQYEIKSISASTAPLLKFIPTSEGYFNFENNKYIYNYVDHLGNVRLSYFHNGSSIEVLEENNYYPFGLKHEGYNGLAGNSSYQYKYNGKELQETGMYDYGARFYMPDIGRWGVIDPLAEKHPEMTPFRYSFNNPINATDPTGLLEEWIQEGDTFSWDDRVIDQETATKFHEGSKYIGKEATVTSIERSTGNVLDRTSLNSDGSVTQNGKTITGNSIEKRSFSNQAGSTFNPRQTAGSFYGISANFAAIGGFGISAGKVYDSVGDSSWYFSFNGNIGLGMGASADIGAVTPTGDNQFLVADFEGKGASYSYGISTPLIDVGGVAGGSLNPGYNSNSDYFRPSNWGTNDRGYTTSQAAITKGTGWGGGAMWTYGQTWIKK